MDERPYKILIVDDSPEDREAFRRAFADGPEAEIIEAATGEQGLSLCAIASPDCVILDHRLPDMEAVGFLASLAGGRSEPPIPVLVLTGQGNEAVAVRALKAGAHEYLVKGAPADEIRRAVRALIERQPRAAEQAYRVVVIEDSAEDREWFRRRLSREGPERFEVREAETGEEGIALCRSFTPDCVLLDYGLPDLNGMEVLAQLNEEFGGNRIAVLMLTGQGSEALAVRSLKAGAEDYLVKGPALDGLRQTIRSAVEKVALRRRLEEERREVLRSRNELALADRRKDEFLAMLAHELRNPLSPLKNALHVLKLRSGDWRAVEQAREIMDRQVGHLARLVDELLDVSRITQGKVKLKLERLDLARLARQCVSDNLGAFDVAGVGLTAEGPATPVWVTGDATRLTQVVDNFLGNALKFTNPGGAVAVLAQAEGERATLTVRDNGIGIDPETLPTVFDLFAQADKSLDRARGGLGLGLTIVKGLIDLHGGSVTARSEGLGRGTEMTVSLPLEQEPPALAPAARPQRSPGPGRRVLVIEDNRDSAESLRMLLEVSGHEVRVAYTGKEGICSAADWRPHAVVCDIGLPEMDGFAVARHLRDEPAMAGVRLIAVTGYGREEEVAKAREAGFDFHLIKPADPEALLEKLNWQDAAA